MRRLAQHPLEYGRSLRGSVGMLSKLAQATVLASASAHWVRHTAGSHMTDREVPPLAFLTDHRQQYGRVPPAAGSAPVH